MPGTLHRPIHPLRLIHPSMKMTPSSAFPSPPVYLLLATTDLGGTAMEPCITSDVLNFTRKRPDTHAHTQRDWINTVGNQSGYGNLLAAQATEGRSSAVAFPRSWYGCQCPCPSWVMRTMMPTPSLTSTYHTVRRAMLSIYGGSNLSLETAY